MHYQIVIVVNLPCRRTQDIQYKFPNPFQVLDVIAPPYTAEFVQLFLPLIDNEDITGSFT